LFSGETRLRLQPLDLAVLNVLLDQYPAAVNRADIWEEVWGLHSDANEENIEKHVSTIRKAIGKDCIETIATIGYRFAVPTRRITGARARQILCKDTPAAGVLALPKESVYAPTGSTTPRIKELVRKHKRLLLSDRLLTSEFRILSFRTEWQPIVTQLINETTSCLRAMVIDRELTRWWNSLPGQAYMIANLNLLKAGRTIKRLFILLSRERHIVDNTLLTAYVHSQLGIEVRLCHFEEVSAFMPFHSDMFSVHDRLFGVLYYLKASDASAQIVVNHPYIAEFVDLYDELFADDALSISLEQALNQHGPSPEFFNVGQFEVALLKRVGGSVTGLLGDVKGEREEQ